MKKKILIVKDNRDLIQVLELLFGVPYETISIINGKQAVDMADTMGPGAQKKLT